MLGCSAYGGRPSQALKARIMRAKELYVAGYAPNLYLAGGIGASPPSEAEVMKRVLFENGVPESAMILENQSHSTAEQAALAGTYMPANASTLIIVSDFFHLWRSCYLFEKEGFETSAAAALESPLYTYKTKAVYYTMKEGFSIIKQFWLETLIVFLVWNAVFGLWMIYRKRANKVSE